MTVVRRDTQDQITGMAKVQVGTKLSTMLGSPPSAVYGWMDDAEAAGITEQYTEAHYAHIRKRIEDTGNPDLLDAFNAKLADGRLSDEQKMFDGYRLLNQHYRLGEPGEDIYKIAEITQKQAEITADPTFNKLCKTNKRGVTYGCTKKNKDGKGYVYCSAPPDQDAPMSQSMVDTINTAIQTNIDFSQLVLWEGNKLQGYVPWGEGAEKNSSGVTIAAGVDLGQRNESEFRRAFKKYPPPFPPETLWEKLKPYIALRRRDACNKLSDIPLTVTQEEADWLNRWQFQDKAAQAKSEYNAVASPELARRLKGEAAITIPDWPAGTSYPEKPLLFQELPTKQQTILTSRTYHTGGLQINGLPLMVRSIMYGNLAIAKDYALQGFENVQDVKTRVDKEFKYASS